MGVISLAKKIIRYWCDPDYRFIIKANLTHQFDSMPDDEFIIRKYRACLGEELNLKQPEGFNEKLQWLKLFDQRDIYTVCADKHAVKEYVANIIGAEYIIPTLGVWDSPNDIDFQGLPDRFVLKCNHNSGLGMYICRNKDEMNIHNVRHGLHKGLKQDYYLTGREWPYKNIPHKIIAEQYMEDSSGGLIDYKVHCFNGEPRFILVCSDRFSGNGLREDFLTIDWQRLPVKRPNIKISEALMEKPAELEEVLELSKKLAKGFPFVRVDFYIINHKVYFSEMTFFPASGFAAFEPDEWDTTFGSWLTLPEMV